MSTKKSLLAIRLAELRKERNLTQYSLAEELGCSRGLLSNYEQGTREPDSEMLIRLATFFDVSVDYLLGKTPTRKWETETLSFNTVDIDGLSDEDIAAVRRIIEGLKDKQHGEKK